MRLPADLFQSEYREISGVSAIPPCYPARAGYEQISLSAGPEGVKDLILVKPPAATGEKAQDACAGLLACTGS